MFGYVTPLKGELKVKDFGRFKCYYCGLCCHIKKQFGNIPRLSLNHTGHFSGAASPSYTYPHTVQTNFFIILFLLHTFIINYLLSFVLSS
ncbi:hypothetical protein ClosIBUN22A_CONTIG72g01464 [Clostridium sp. IBUN22A]|nr:hypothetical protein ClosIBUN22A_CONTIG72g01464 [Clostridium sp. IBUN22A]